MGFDFSADPDLLNDRSHRSERRPVRLKFSLSRAQHDALLLVASDGIAAGKQSIEITEKAALAVRQMKRQDEVQKRKKGS